MGTDYGSFLVEAGRVLRPGGWLWIAEVRSRFAAGSSCSSGASKHGGGSKASGGSSSGEDFGPFLAALAQLGFKLVQQDASNRMFVVWVLKKQQQQQVGGNSSPHQSLCWPALRACMYKKR